ncbi:hypothetical protein [Piscinibacter sakaiensis]|uniref:hypothetical protein n=1 Tax=Piscinibacter sakaiensis TaxID=1547922 RepID=UPI003AAE4F07
MVDTVESVRLLQRDEGNVISRWRRFIHEVTRDVLPPLDGRLVKSLGDGLLIEFAGDPTSVIEAAFEMNRRIATFNDPMRPDLAIVLRLGGHIADVVIDELDIYGHGVNLAARLATLGGGGELIVSDELRDLVLPGVDAEVEDLGLCYLKNLDGPQRAFRIAPVRQGLSTGAAPAGDGAVHGGAEERAGIAVIPFAPRGGAAEQEPIGHVLADDIIAVLSRIPGLRVVSRLSSAWFSRRNESEATMAKLLDVQYVLRGNFLVRGTRLRLFANLHQLQSGETVWADEFDADVDALLGGDSPTAADAAAAVCRAIVGCEAQRAQTVPLYNLQSYSILFAAISLMHRLTQRDFQRAGDMLNYLVARHPKATTPRAWLGKWHVLKVAQGYSSEPTDDARQAHAVVQQALDLDSEHALALAIDGLICAYIGKDLATAGRRYEAALRANPNEGLALLFQASLHAYEERGTDAVNCALRAQRLSPLDPLRYYYDNFTCLAHLSADDYPAAVEVGMRSLRANRSHASTLRMLAIAQSLGGDLPAARATVAELLTLEPGFTREAFFKRFPGPPGERTTRYADALSAAGLP